MFFDIDRNNKVSSFTVIELVVVLLISSLLILFLWQGFQFVISRGVEGVKYTDGVRELILFDSRMQTEFEKSSYIYIEDNVLAIVLSSKNEIKYVLGKTNIVRKSQIECDTLELRVLSLKTTDAQIKNVKNRPLCSLEIEVFSKEVNCKFVFVYEKHYDFAFIFNYCQ